MNGWYPTVKKMRVARISSVEMQGAAYVGRMFTDGVLLRAGFDLSKPYEFFREEIATGDYVAFQTYEERKP